MTKYHLTDLPIERSDQASFHVASESHVRVQFMRLKAGQPLAPVRYAGDVVVTCVGGSLDVSGVSLSTLEQCVVAEGQELTVAATSPEAVVQLIWTPPFAETSQADSSTQT